MRTRLEVAWFPTATAQSDGVGLGLQPTPRQEWVCAPIHVWNSENFRLEPVNLPLSWQSLVWFIHTRSPVGAFPGPVPLGARELGERTTRVWGLDTSEDFRPNVLMSPAACQGLTFLLLLGHSRGVFTNWPNTSATRGQMCGRVFWLLYLHAGFAPISSLENTETNVLSNMR